MGRGAIKATAPVSEKNRTYFRVNLRTTEASLAGGLCMAHEQRASLAPGPMPVAGQAGRGRVPGRFATAWQAPRVATASPRLRSGTVCHGMAFIRPAAGKPRLFRGSSTDRPGSRAPTSLGCTGVAFRHVGGPSIPQADIMCASLPCPRCASNEQAAVASAWWSCVHDQGASEPPGLGLRDPAVGLSFRRGDGSGWLPARLHPLKADALPRGSPPVPGVLPGSAARGPGALGGRQQQRDAVLLLSAGVAGRWVPSTCS